MNRQMIKNKFNKAARLILILMVCPIGKVIAQIPTKNNSAPPDEIRKDLEIVEANPDSLKAHKTYIYAMGLNNPLLALQYKKWMEKYPKKEIIPLAIGTAYYNAEMPQAKEYLLKAAAIEPKNAKTWSMLSIDAYRWGQKDLGAEYIRKATLADSLNADYAYGYLMSFALSDSIQYKLKVFNFTKRFPTSEYGAQALYWLGTNATNLADKINYFEYLRQIYPPQKFNWSSAAMIGLADAYMQTDPGKALALINQMGDGNNWTMRKLLAESLIRIDKLEQHENYKDASNELNRVKLPAFNYFNDFISLKKAALQEKAGNLKGAYDSLAIKFAYLPTDQLGAALELYGRKIGKEKGQVAIDIETSRYNGAIAAFPFQLGLYTGDRKLNLKDLKGKVVLLTFWFPGCGPCRNEFPYFQAVIDKFNSKEVAYIGVNVYPEQDPYVIPFMENTKYSFIPLRGSQEFAAKYYGVDGEPENFVIDKEGKIIFKDFSVNNANQRSLELMISSLLQKGRQNN